MRGAFKGQRSLPARRRRILPARRPALQFGGVQEVAQVPPLHDYVILDGRLGFEKGPVEVAAFAENLFDESYIVFDAITPTGFTTRFNIPRTYGLQVRYTW